MLRFDTFLKRRRGGTPTPTPTPSDIVFVGGKIWKGAGDSADWRDFDFTGLSGGVASSPLVNDYFLLIGSSGGDGGNLPPVLGTEPTGVESTAIVNGYYNGSRDTNLKIWEGVYESGSASGGQFGALASSRPCTGGILVFRGVDGLDVTPTVATGARPSTTNPPAITPVTAGALIVAVGAAGRINGLEVYTTPIDLVDFFTTTLFITRSNTLGFGMKTDWTAGPFDPAIFAGLNSTTNDGWVAATLALRPS